jgi:hypothetical protein
MTVTRNLFLTLGVTAMLLLAPRLSRAEPPEPLEPYCCVCTGCATGAATQCIPVAALGGMHADCPTRCATQNCNFLEVLDGVCAEHAAECMPSPAPAASRPVLFALGISLAGCGVYLVRRRLAR